MKTPDAHKLDFYDGFITEKIVEKYGLSEQIALRRFLSSETYKMLLDADTGLYAFSPLVLFDLWECEQVTGDPRSSQYIREEI